MKEQLPSSDFNPFEYERPNRKWVCGRAAEGKPCHLGPDAKGRCRVTAECRPALKIPPGETKGSYFCTRPAAQGGPCASGPLPDGTCPRTLPKCAPVLSWRARRKILTIALCMLTTGFLLTVLCGPWRWRFLSPGPVSAPHATAAFARRGGFNDNCPVCHGAARRGLFGWAQVAFSADPAPFDFHAMAAPADPGMTAIDGKCLKCHEGHTFHEPNVVAAHSCASCHVEHQGPGPMRAPADAQCLSCHANSAVMEASAKSGEKLPPSAFAFRPDFGRVVFRTPRPAQGYTEIIHSFATDHPEFAVLRDHLKDPDTLKFNHELHLTSSVVTWQGRKLECADCHRLDAAGAFYLKVTYEEDCRKCHAIQFDVRNPGLTVPHGNAENARAFLRTLPQQYADYSARQNGGASRERDTAFAQEQMRLLQADFISGEELERSVFFNEQRAGPAGPSRFPGCAYCHEVKESPGGVPQVTAPVMPERWLPRGGFDHKKHQQNIQSLARIDCAFCHDAVHSRLASDVLLPSKQTCAQCHSPAGGVSSSCATCHVYHSPRRAGLSVTAAATGMDCAETLRKAIVSRDR